MKVKRRTFIKLAGATALTFASGRFSFAQNTFRADRVILVCWDGCERTRLKTLLNKGALPNLQHLVSQGSIAELECTCSTRTKPAHAEMLTGYNYDVTEVYTNLNYKPVKKGISVFERLKDHFGSDNFRTVFIASKPENVGGGEVTLKKGWRKTVEYMRVFYHMAHSCDFRAEDISRHQDRTGPLVIKTLRKYSNEPGFMFFHFHEPDHIGHYEGGEGSPVYSRSIVRNDYWLGEIMKESSDSTAILVTTDHGFDIGPGPHLCIPKAPNLRWGHSYAPKCWLASNLPLRRKGILLDIAPTIYRIFGVDQRKYLPPLHGTSLLKSESLWRLNEKPLPAYKLKKGEVSLELIE